MLFCILKGSFLSLFVPGNTLVPLQEFGLLEVIGDLLLLKQKTLQSRRHASVVGLGRGAGILFCLFPLFFSSLFPLNENVHQMKTRNPERYVIKNGNTDRMKRSAVPFLQRLLNDDINRQRKDLRNLLQVNNGIYFNAPIT